MSGNENGNLRDTGPRQHPPGVSPTTRQMGAVGERRRDAEEKLEHHLQEARHQDASPDDDAGPEDPGEPGVVESADVAAIQNDDRLTASDRVDLIANQVVAGDRDGRDRPEPPGRP